jgi:hypothetical protein
MGAPDPYDLLHQMLTSFGNLQQYPSNNVAKRRCTVQNNQHHIFCQNVQLNFYNINVNKIQGHNYLTSFSFGFTERANCTTIALPWS